jgi:hypothetical protein
MKTSAFQTARAPALLAAALCVALLTGCGHMPWGKRPAAAPVPVNELVESAADGTPTQVFPQYWKRNTLVIDLQSAAASGGTLTLKPRDGAKWPVRLAFRVMPGTLGLIEVQADQRLLMPVTREGTQPVDLQLVPGVYTAKTQQITIKWEAWKAPPS